MRLLPSLVTYFGGAAKLVALLVHFLTAYGAYRSGGVLLSVGAFLAPVLSELVTIVVYVRRTGGVDPYVGLCLWWLGLAATQQIVALWGLRAMDRLEG